MFQRRFLILLSFILLLPRFILSQTGMVTGYVRDIKSREGLPGANVIIRGAGIGAAADNNGYFVLNAVPIGKVIVEASRIGYSKVSSEIEIKSQQTVTIDLMMEAEAVKFGEVLITATRINALQSEVTVSADVIDRPEIEKSSSQNVGEILESASGTFIKNYGHIGGLKTASIRGASENQVLILLDGQRLNLAQGTAPDLSDVPLQSIEKIEIIRGGNSALYGTDAVGGVVNLITRSGPDKPVSGQVKSGLGSFGTQIVEGNFSQKIGNFDYHLSHNYTESDGDFKFKNPEGQTVMRTNNGLRWNNTFAKLRFAPNPTSLISGYVQIHDANRHVPGPLSFPSEAAVQKDESWKYNIFYQSQVSREIGIRSQAYFHKFSQNFDDPEAFSPIQSEHKNDISGLSLQGNLRISNSNNIVSGVELRHEKTRSTDIDSQDRTINSAFIQDEIRIGLSDNSEFTLLPAIRLDHYSDLDTQFSPKVGFLFSIVRDYSLSLNGNWGRSFRAASFNDLYWPAGAFTAGNPNLKPEKSSGFDLGLRINFRNNGYWGVEVNYFNTGIDDLIIWGPEADQIWRPQNVQEANIKGIETSFNFSDLSELVDLNFEYSYLDAVDAVTKNDLIYRPRHKVDARFNLDLNRFEISGGFRYIGKRFANADNSASVESYTLTNLGLEFKQPISQTQVRFQFELRNVFDRRVQIIDGFPVPGREFRSTIGFSF